MAVRKKTKATHAPPNPPAKPAARKQATAVRWSLAEAMKALEKAGSPPTKKTYLRHGAKEPLFGVTFATLKDLLKKIGVDHDLALALWDTGNFDARNLAVKIADPLKMKVADLDRWACDNSVTMCRGYVAALAGESSHGASRADAWLSSRDVTQRATGWSVVGALAMRDLATPDAWFLARLTEIEKSIHAAPNEERSAMNQALISLGCRSAAFRKTVTAAAKRIGPVTVDHGDTACKTPDAVAYISKSWDHSVAKRFESPAAQERSRESMRLRC